MANIVRIGSKSPKILVSKMVWLGVRNGAKMVKIGGKWGEKSKIFQAVPCSKMVNFTPFFQGLLHDAGISVKFILKINHLVLSPVAVWSTSPSSYAA